jgi:alkylhydroperoxidase family enzyme
MGVTQRQLMELPQYETSDAFTDLERAAIDLAVAMAKTPAGVAETVTARLRTHFDEAQLVELASAIAWENYRSRFNRVFNVQSAGFCEGGFCALPEVTHAR